VVGYGCYHIVGNSFIYNSHETILMLGIASFVVKIVKQELEVDNILPHYFDVLIFFVFIELTYSFSGEDLTSLPL
jgi:hypothetical protein